MRLTFGHLMTNIYIVQVQKKMLEGPTDGAMVFVYCRYFCETFAAVSNLNKKTGIIISLSNTIVLINMQKTG